MVALTSITPMISIATAAARWRCRPRGTAYRTSSSNSTPWRNGARSGRRWLGSTDSASRGGSSRADYQLAGDFSGSDGPFSSSVVSPDPNYYRRLNFRGTGAVRPWPNLEVSASVARTTGNLRLPPDILTSAVFGPSDGANFSWAPSFRGSNTQGLGRTSGVVAAPWTPLPWPPVHGPPGGGAPGAGGGPRFFPTPTGPRYLARRR